MQFHFTIKYLPGKFNSAADALSSFLGMNAEPDTENSEQEEELQVAVCSATLTALSQDDCITLDEDDVREAARDDPVYPGLLAKARTGD